MSEAVSETMSEVASKDGASLRLHPATLVIGALRRLPELMLGLPAAAYFIGNMGVGLALVIALAGLVLSVAISVVHWLRFSYRLADEQLVIESGVLSRNRRTIPFDRIQDVSLEQSLLARIFGVSIVRIETGSAGKDEGKLECVSGAEAERLRDTIRRHRAGLSADAHPSEPDAAEEPAPVLFAMGFDRLLVAGVFNFSLVFLALIGAVWQYFGSFLPAQFADPDYWFGKQGEAILGMVSVVAAVSVIGVLLLVGMLTGIIRTFLRDYGFRLSRTETGFRRVRGLFTRTDVVMPLRRVQAAIVSTGLVRRYFGWHGLALQSLGTDGGRGTHHSAAPFARIDELTPILSEMALPDAPPKQEFQRVSHRMISRSWLEDGAALVFAMAVVAQIWPGWLWLLLALPILIAAPILQYAAHGYRIEGALLFVRSGVWKPKTVILPLVKVQSATIRQSILQRGFGLASIMVGTAGASRAQPLQIRDVSIDDAKRLLAGDVTEFARGVC